VTGLVATFGSGAMTNAVPELENADCILITGSNTTEGHPLIATRIFRAVEKGAKLIVVDPRRIQIAKKAMLHLRQRPGSDVAWINGLMHVIVAEGLANQAFVSARTEGFDELKTLVAEYTPEKVEAISGIPAEQLRQAARLYAQAERGSIVYAMGITQHTTGHDNVRSLANLAMLTGHVGRESTGVNPLRGQNNVQGACDLGGLPNVYTGYQRVTDAAVQQKFREMWGRTSSLEVGLTVTEIGQAAHDGTLKALYIMAENPMLSDPDVRHLEKSLQHLDFLVVQDIFMTETAQLAHLVLPGASFAEKEGTFTGTDRRLQRVRQAIPPLGDARADWEIICQVAKRLEARLGQESNSAPYGGWDYASPQEVMDEIAAVTPIYGGVSYARLEELGSLQWPVPTLDHPGTPYLHENKFSRGLGKFNPVEWKAPAEEADADYPFTLTTGRIMFHFHTGTMTRRSEKLDKEVPEAYAEINPADAVLLDIGQGEKMRLVSRRGEIELNARITPRVPEKVVFVPFHFTEARANVLTQMALDPVAKIPEYKVSAVRVEKA
jgi:formate dehydrogenase alpha subunit